MKKTILSTLIVLGSFAPFFAFASGLNPTSTYTVSGAGTTSVNGVYIFSTLGYCNGATPTDNLFSNGTDFLCYDINNSRYLLYSSFPGSALYYSATLSNFLTLNGVDPAPTVVEVPGVPTPNTPALLGSSPTVTGLLAQVAGVTGDTFGSMNGWIVFALGIFTSFALGKFVISLFKNTSKNS